MRPDLELASIPDKEYSDYRYDVIFKAYKWDPKVGDSNTVSKHAVLMNTETYRQLEAWAESLSEETMLMEEALIKNTDLAKELGFSKKINKTLSRLSEYKRDKNIRLMRFDFHPTETGWAVSEINSDVPGGFAEASILPEIAEKYFDGYKPGRNLANALLNTFKAKLTNESVVAFIHATSYSDDRQVMQFLSDHFNKNNINTIFAAPDQIKWIDKKAISLLDGYSGKIDGIVRFFPLEWLENLPRKSNWEGYYDCETISCNHPAAIFAQSKRLPLIWDRLGIEIPTWKKLLPETKNPKLIKPSDSGWIYKPALGRVGEDISIRSVLNKKDISRIEKSVRHNPKDWIAQKMFKSQPIISDDNKAYHLCVGAFTVNGKSAGFYARISPYPLIDAKAEDIPVLVI